MPIRNINVQGINVGLEIIAGMFVFSISLIGSAAAQEPRDPLESLGEPSRMFALTCLAHVFSKDDLTKRLAGNKYYLEYNPAQGERFLRGKPGKAWGTRGTQSDYVIALNDSGFCSVYAAKADQERSTGDLKKMMQILFPAAELIHITDERAGPINDLIKSEGWYFAIPDKNRTPMFFVSTSKDPNVHFEAVYTIGAGNPDARLD